MFFSIIGIKRKNEKNAIKVINDEINPTFTSLCIKLNKYTAQMVLIMEFDNPITKLIIESRAIPVNPIIPLCFLTNTPTNGLR